IQELVSSCPPRNARNAGHNCTGSQRALFERPPRTTTHLAQSDSPDRRPRTPNGTQTDRAACRRRGSTFHTQSSTIRRPSQRAARQLRDSLHRPSFHTLCYFSTRTGCENNSLYEMLFTVTSVLPRGSTTPEFVVSFIAVVLVA